MIQVGERLPEAKFFESDGSDIKTLTTAEIFAGHKVLVIGVVGAFSPVCGVSHLPEYIPLVETFQQYGDVNRVICLCAADPFTMRAWGKSLGIRDDTIRMITDNNADFADKIGLAIDLSGIGLARRSTRYSMVVKDGIVDRVSVEKSPYDVDLTSAQSMLSAIAA